MSEQIENLENGNGESSCPSWLGRAMSALYHVIPINVTFESDRYFPVPGALVRCPECGAGVEFRLIAPSAPGRSVLVGIRCSAPDLRNHFYDDTRWKSGNEWIGEMIQQFWFLKKNGLPFDRPVNEKEREHLERLIADMKDETDTDGESDSDSPVG